MSGGPTDDRPVVTVVGLGPAGPDLVTAGTHAAVAAHRHRFLRTQRHPAAAVLEGAPSFDDVYERSERLEDVYVRIVEELVAAAQAHGAVLYAVPGSPVVAERTVERLQVDPRVRCVIEPSLSFLDLAWARLGVDPVAAGVRVVDGHRFEQEAAGERGPLLVAQCDTVDVLSDVKLAIGEALDRRALDALVPRAGTAAGTGTAPSTDQGDVHVTVLQRLGLPDERIVEVPWHELDRVVQPDHLTSVWLPAHCPPVGRELAAFAELVATLRRDCPWDRQQTHESLKRHLLEESYEVLDAVDHLVPDDPSSYSHLEEELGDLLFQVVFHATLAAEAGQFTLADVAATVHEKLYRRHPHVFGDVAASDARQVAANWEDLKKAEKGRDSVFDGIPEALPALLFALKVEKKAEALLHGSTVGDGMPGPDLSGADEVPTLAEAVGRFTATPDADGLGLLLLAVVDTARVHDLDPEDALRASVRARRDSLRELEQG